MNELIADIRKKINEAIPEGRVVTDHDEKGHFYIIDDISPSPRYPSVTAKLQILKDESLINYKMNRAVEYVFRHWKKFTDDNILEHIDRAERVATEILFDAGDIGTDIHDYREAYFKDWIKTGRRPEDILSYIPSEKEDIRAKSALRALDKFITQHRYTPIVSELYVYSHKLKTAGTLDDLGLMYWPVRNRYGDRNCLHPNSIISVDGKKMRCMECEFKGIRRFVLMDVKTSNQLKDHFFFQVALYYWMFKELTGLRPEIAFILKLSKEDGQYKMENLRQPSKLASYARSMVRTKNGIEFIREIRKDNLKRVVTL